MEKKNILVNLSLTDVTMSFVVEFHLTPELLAIKSKQSAEKVWE